MSRVEYPCKNCNELFFVYRDMENHMMKTHNTIKVWTCKKCLQSFQGVDEFDRHIEYDHKSVPLFSMGLAASDVARRLKEGRL